MLATGMAGQMRVGDPDLGRLRGTRPEVHAVQVATEKPATAQVSGFAGQCPRVSLVTLTARTPGTALDERRDFISGHALAKGAVGEAVRGVKQGKDGRCSRRPGRIA